ncbi:MAG TPA: hypothetical protein VGI66_01150 [Streptosporangiaceae bacterium]
MTAHDHGSHLAVDGDSGLRTGPAVRCFRARHHLTADEIVGDQTSHTRRNDNAGAPIYSVNTVFFQP